MDINPYVITATAPSDDWIKNFVVPNAEDSSDFLGDYVCDKSLVGSSRKYININNNTNIIFYYEGAWGLTDSLGDEQYGSLFWISDCTDPDASSQDICNANWSSTNTDYVCEPPIFSSVNNGSDDSESESFIITSNFEAIVGTYALTTRDSSQIYDVVYTNSSNTAIQIRHNAQTQKWELINSVADMLFLLAHGSSSDDICTLDWTWDGIINPVGSYTFQITPEGDSSGSGSGTAQVIRVSNAMYKPEGSSLYLTDDRLSTLLDGDWILTSNVEGSRVWTKESDSRLTIRELYDEQEAIMG